LIAGQSEGSFLPRAVEVRVGAGLNAKRDSFVCFMPKCEIVPWTLALFSFGVPLVRLFAANFGTSGIPHVAQFWACIFTTHRLEDYRTGTRCAWRK
jgi:hypothetical protein